MNTEKRPVADYAGTGLAVAKYPMRYRRQELQLRNVLSAIVLRRCRDGEFVRAAGCVIARQRPETAKGFIFISMEDETGIANVIVTPNLYEQEWLTVVRTKFPVGGGRIAESGWRDSCEGDAAHGAGRRRPFHSTFT
jgi:error-prone DNA polymerase